MRKLATLFVIGIITAQHLTQAASAQVAASEPVSLENAASHVESRKSEVTEPLAGETSSVASDSPSPSSSPGQGEASSHTVPSVQNLNDGEAPKTPALAAPQTPTEAQDAPEAPAASVRKPVSPSQTAKDSAEPSKDKDEIRKTAKPKTKAAIDVKLTPEQSLAIVEIRKKAETEVEKRLTEELKVARADMNAAMVDATPAADVRKKFDLVQKKYLELQKIKFEKTLKIREVLSVEQRKKLQTMKSSH